MGDIARPPSYNFVQVQLGFSSMADWVNLKDISINVYAFSFSTSDKEFLADQIACLTVADLYYYLGRLLLAAELTESAKSKKEADDILREWLLDYKIRDFGYSSMQD